MKSMEFPINIIIPARYASSRFPGKLLADLHGKPVLQWVYESAVRTPCVQGVWVAAADEQIAEAVRAFGGRVFLSRKEHQSGTDRCAEAAQVLGLDEGILINLQADEPFVRSRQIEQLAQALQAGAPIATLCYPLAETHLFQDPNCVKVVCDLQGYALYFSRAAIPHRRDAAAQTALSSAPAAGSSPAMPCKHLGIYGFRPGILPRLAALPPTPLEELEKLEQLRWLQHGFRIQVLQSETDSPGIDTEEDLQRARAGSA